MDGWGEEGGGGGKWFLVPITRHWVREGVGAGGMGLEREAESEL